jgi:hypothetical protein
MSFTSLVVGLLLVAGAFVLTLLQGALNGHLSPGDAPFFYVPLFTFVIGGALLAWRDTYAFAVLVSLLGGFALAGVGLVCSAGVPTGSGVVLVGVAAVLTIAAGLAFIVRTQLRRGPLPDVFAERFGRRGVFESGGVQIAAFTPVNVAANIIFPVDVYLQNCVDAPRTVDIALDDQPLIGAGGGIRCRKPAPVTLAPAEVKLVQLPVCAGRANTLTPAAYVCVRADGPRGNRIRHRRAPYAARPLPRWLVALIVVLAWPLFIVIVSGRGGIKLQFRFTPAGPLRRDDELPEPTVTTLWPITDDDAAKRRAG